MILQGKYLVLVATVAVLAPLGVFTSSSSSVETNRRVELVNRSGKKLVVDWINPHTGTSQPVTQDFDVGTTTILNTFVNHTFAIHEPSSSPSCGALDGDDDCGVQYLTIHENDEQQMAVVNRNLQVSYQKMNSNSDVRQSRMDECHSQAQADLLEGHSSNEVMDELSKCMTKVATTLFQEKNNEIAFEEKVRLEISHSLENHTCSDPTRETTEPQEVRSWTHVDRYGQKFERPVYIFHNRSSSQIHAIKNFITAEECDAITAAAKPILHRGTVADGSGGSRLSDTRKAWQAGIEVPWGKEDEGDLIAKVVRRIYDYTNHAVGYNLSVEGQEELMSIQYFGIARNSTAPPDQYRPHCDGECDGLRHKTGGRVATMVMYCDAPELGGGTNFQNSNVFVKPEVGTAAFFSYLSIDTMTKDTGFTTHSGCPVIEGTKRIAVHWMRHGVDRENPWNSFNTLTVKREEAEGC